VGLGASGAAVGFGTVVDGAGAVLVGLGAGAEVVDDVSSLQLVITKLKSNTTAREMKNSFFIFPPKLD
jgi:hypothetical protein